MSGDCNIYGGLNNNSQEVNWGSIKGKIFNQSDLSDELNKKVDKENGKNLSSNDFTDELKEKLININKT